MIGELNILSIFKSNVVLREMLHSQYFYNIFIINYMCLAIIGSNLKLTLPTITTCHLGFVVKMLWTYHFSKIKNEFFLMIQNEL